MTERASSGSNPLAPLVRGASGALRRAVAAPPVRFAARWPDTRRPPRSRGREAPADPPVLRALPRVLRSMHARRDPLSIALGRALPLLLWRRTYRAGEVDGHFLANYAWSEFIGRTGPWRSRSLACGLLLLGPRTLYPSHAHPAEELYLTIAGNAEWRRAGGRWRRVPPGGLILHRSGEPHSMRTRGAPLLALYVWRGHGLAQSARLVEVERRPQPSPARRSP
ncbi:MAG: AraC family ligand binding domain-containing protein [Gammaproteobacteria bacterium]|nr:AraC family ligand binding domain-containing protein [Gammaproteobacteria bacterium]